MLIATRPQSLSKAPHVMRVIIEETGYLRVVTGSGPPDDIDMSKVGVLVLSALRDTQSRRRYLYTGPPIPSAPNPLDSYLMLALVEESGHLRLVTEEALPNEEKLGNDDDAIIFATVQDERTGYYYLYPGEIPPEESQTPVGEILTVHLLIEETGYLRSAVLTKEPDEVDMTKEGIIGLPTIRDEDTGYYYLYSGLPTKLDEIMHGDRSGITVRTCSCYSKKRRLVKKLLKIVRKDKYNV